MSTIIKLPYNIKYPRNRAEAIRFAKYINFIITDAELEKDKRMKCKKISRIIKLLRGVMLEMEKNSDNNEDIKVAITEVKRLIKIPWR